MGSPSPITPFLGALRTRIEFGFIYFYNYNKEPPKNPLQNPLLTIKAPTLNPKPEERLHPPAGQRARKPKQPLTCAESDLGFGLCLGA